MQKIIEIRDGVVRHPQYKMAEPINFELLAGEQLAIVGDNGSGKSRLVYIAVFCNRNFDESRCVQSFADTAARWWTQCFLYL